MESVQTKSANSNKSKKLARTLQKVINLRTATKIASNNGICILTSQARVKEDPLDDQIKCHHFCAKYGDDDEAKHRAVMEALVAKLFASITTIKAAYAELQMAQNPYNTESIQAADQAVVDELRAISELKRSFLKKELNLSPQITVMLAEIQEQQSLMRTYGITIKKLEAESEKKDSDIAFLRKKHEQCIAYNKSLEKKLNSSGVVSMFDNLRISVLNPSHFVQFLHHTLRSIRSFVKFMIKEMESARWDLDAAVKFIHPDAVFTKPSHRNFSLESYVSITMFEGFNHPNFNVHSESLSLDRQSKNLYFEKFKKLKSLHPKQYLAHNPNSSITKFTKTKYLQLVHAKMECSFFGNLNQRKVMNSGGFPDSPFFIAFAEMAKRVWALHYLSLSFDEEVTIFLARENCRFSEVYMECVSEESLVSSSTERPDSSGELRVGFTVVPGFKIGTTVIQSQVYLSQVASPASC